MTTHQGSATDPEFIMPPPPAPKPAPKPPPNARHATQATPPPHRPKPSPSPWSHAILAAAVVAGALITFATNPTGGEATTTPTQGSDSLPIQAALGIRDTKPAPPATSGEILHIAKTTDAPTGTATIQVASTSNQGHAYQLQATAANTGTDGDNNTPLGTTQAFIPAGQTQTLQLPLSLNPTPTQGFATITLTDTHLAGSGAQTLDVAIISFNPDCNPDKLAEGYHCWNNP